LSWLVDKVSPLAKKKVVDAEKKIGEMEKQWEKEAKEVVGGVKGKAEELVEEGKKKLEKGKGKVEELVEEGKKKVESGKEVVKEKVEEGKEVVKEKTK